MESTGKFVCLGDCQTCQALLEGRVDPIECPIRILMGRTARLEKALSGIVSMIQAIPISVGKTKFEDIQIEEGQLKIEVDEE